MSNATKAPSGLDGVVVAETRLSRVDGARGRLVIGGYEVDDLAGRVDFESACHLLWRGALPTPEEHRALCAALGRWRVAAAESMRGSAPPFADVMDGLRAALAWQDWRDVPEDERKLAATAATAVALAMWCRRHEGQPVVAPDPALGHAEDLLRMATGVAPDPARVAALDAYLVTVCDHGMNASTFAARVVASTGSDLGSAVVAGVGALKGPLHGGAPGPVLDMIDAVGEAGAARAWLESELAAGRRIMGMGHRIYRVRDPRAAVLERAVERLEQGGLRTRRLSLARAVEAAAAALLKERYPDRPLQANVEFYTAVLLDAIGLPREAFSGVFAASRVAGWCAHYDEQRATGRLIRPESTYVGPEPSSRHPS